MGQTSKGIKYPNNYSEVADVPSAMQEMAESIDNIIFEDEEGVMDLTRRLTNLEMDNTTNKQDISNIKQEQTTQNSNIQTNANNITNLQRRVLTNETDISNIKAEQTTQSTDIKNLDDELLIHSSNIANTEDLSATVILANGTEQEHATYKSSIFYRVDSTKKYSGANIVYLALYDINKNFISRIQNVTENMSFPADTKFVRISSNTSIKKWQLNEGETLLDYEKYYVKINEKLLDEIITNLNYKLDNSLDISTDELSLIEANNNYQGTLKYHFEEGHTYIITNNDPNGESSYTSLNAYTRKEETSENLETIAQNLSNNDYIVFNSTEDAEYLRIIIHNQGSCSITDLTTLQSQINMLKKDIEDVKESISNDVGEYSNNLYNDATSIRKKVVSADGTINDNSTYKLSDFIEVERNQNISFDVWDGTAQGKGVSSIALYTKSKNFIKRLTYNVDFTTNTINTENAKYIRLNLFNRYRPVMVNFGDEVLEYEEFGWKSKGALKRAEDRINTLYRPPLAKFEITHDLKDVSEDVAKMDYTNKWQQNNVMQQIYALFDELVENYPEYVSREDIAETLNMEYPSYASSYKTYMYKFIYNDTALGNDNANKKKKALIIGGTHGNEIAAPFNLYLFARQLCEDCLKDENFFKLRCSFNFYIIPCLNGYGMLNVQRGNGNDVNINRNYPINLWAAGGADTKDSATACDYTGTSAGSEFETQLVMGITDVIKPELAIDHHNYSKSINQFYSDMNNSEGLKLCYQSALDCSYAFKKNLSSYFGNDFGVVVKNNAASPAILAHDTWGTTTRWWFEHGVFFSCCIEVSECINYWNGEYADQRLDNFGNDTFAVAEYTLRNQILRYAQYVLDNSEEEEEAE